MSKKEGKGLKSFNKGFQVPDTYIIIFLVVVVAALLTFLVPKGFYETQDISYMINGVEKTRTVIKDGSFQYLTDDAGNVVTEGVALFSGDGGTGFFNYMYNGIVSSSAIEIIAFLMVVGGAFGIMIRTGAIVFSWWSSFWNGRRSTSVYYDSLSVVCSSWIRFSYCSSCYLCCNTDWFRFIMDESILCRYCTGNCRY